MRASSLLALTCSLFAASLFAGETLRFSQSLTAEQRSSSGVTQLNSDQVAALDALVRLDAHQAAAAARKAAIAAPKPSATTPESPAAPQAARPSFTQALSVDQRRAAGLDTLTAEQQREVDTLVAQLAPAGVHYEPASATAATDAVEFFPNRYEVHGEVGFGLGGGSGYSSREAWMSTTLLDTKTGTALSVGVSSSSEKWKGPYRYRNNWDDVGIGLGTPVFGTH